MESYPGPSYSTMILSIHLALYGQPSPIGEFNPSVGTTFAPPFRL